MRELKKALRYGFLLHGSPHLFEMLEPRSAHDDFTEGGNQTAVYTTDFLVGAVFKALIHRKGSSCHTGWSWNEVGGDKILRLFGENIELADGYVYVLDSTGFQPVPGTPYQDESFSLTPQYPITIVPVTINDLLELQNQEGFLIDIH